MLITGVIFQENIYARDNWTSKQDPVYYIFDCIRKLVSSE